MDDFSIYGTSFDSYLANLCKLLQRCEESEVNVELGEVLIIKNCARSFSNLRRNRVG
jgi:hypothetical protein